MKEKNFLGGHVSRGPPHLTQSDCLYTSFSCIDGVTKRKETLPLGIIISFLMGVFIGFTFSNFVFKNLRQGCDSNNSFEVLNRVTRRNNYLLFVGVMTADKYLDTRAKAIYETWGKSLLGSIMFFTSENSSSKANIPLVKLANVDDSYPPQKKSLEMIKYMYQHYPQFKFYLRADDDLYVRTETLQKFLNSVNSSKPLLIGRPGYGIKEERPFLHLLKNKPFCMGGPGIVISNKALQLLSKHMNSCVHLYRTPHEDVELWRCMNYYVGISCTKSEEVRQYFYHQKDLENVVKVAVHKKDVANTLTLHPLKCHDHLYKLHLALLIMQIQDKEYEIYSTMDVIKKMRQLLSKDLSKRLKQGASFGKSEISITENIDNVEWSIYHHSTYYTASNIYDDSSFVDSPMNIVQEDVESYLLNSANRPTYDSEFYVRNLPGVGTEFIFEILMMPTVRKFAKASILKRRRHRVKIPFGTLIVREIEKESYFETLLRP